MKDELHALLVTTLSQMGVQDVSPDISIPEDSQHGEYSTNVALRLTKVLKKSPMDIALQVKEVIQAQKDKAPSFNHNHSTDQHGQSDAAELLQNNTIDILRDIEKVEIVAPGFINFFVAEAKLSTNIKQLLNEDWAVPKAQSKSKKITVEFTDPNPFKELHIGHLYSNAVGESISRIHEALGWEVKRADYFGDVGMHVAKSIWGMQKLMADESLGIPDIEKKTLGERVKWLGKAYALGSKVFEEDEKVAQEIKQLNKRIFIAVQRSISLKSGITPVVDYSKGEQVDEKELEKLSALFLTGRKWSLDYFDSMYDRLGTKFDYYYPESEVAEYGAKLVLDHIGDVFEKSDGAVVYRGEKHGLHTRVFINSLGLPTYEAKELGLNWKKHEDFPADVSLIVTGNEINEYFKVLLSAMKDIMPHVAVKTKHIGHGMVRLPEGKMSSRTGKVVAAEDLIDTVKSKISDILHKSESKYSESEQTDISEKAAIAAIKYSMLRVSLPGDLIFDIDTSVSFDGDSGPYLQYTYARCKSVLRKAGSPEIKLSGGLAFNIEEKSLARLLLYIVDKTKEAGEAYTPNVLCTYVFEVAQAYNNFYAKHSILDSTEDVKKSRLALTRATSVVIKQCLSLLGIDVLEQM